MLSVNMVKKRVAHTSLEVVTDKVLSGKRLKREDGLALWESNDILSIAWLADYRRQQIAGDAVYFINNSHLNHTNVCVSLCELCAFGKEAQDTGAYTLSLPEIRDKAKAAAEKGVSEIHVVGGLNKDLPLDYYLKLLRTLREEAPYAHLQAFGAVEIDFIAQKAGLSLRETLLLLKEVGLGSLPGGGAEIANPAVRKKICSEKISFRRWLEVHAVAHAEGIKSNATMLYGHVESPADRVDHLLALRRLQDDTGGFQSFIPLSFHPENTKLSNLTACDGYTDLKALAIGRLMLDNFKHIKAFWIMLGMKLAQVSLFFGVNDLDGTVYEEKITHAAGAKTGHYQPPERFVAMIKEAGRKPVERDTLYNVVRDDF